MASSGRCRRGWSYLSAVRWVKRQAATRLAFVSISSGLPRAAAAAHVSGGLTKIAAAGGGPKRCQPGGRRERWPGHVRTMATDVQAFNTPRDDAGVRLRREELRLLMWHNGRTGSRSAGRLTDSSAKAISTAHNHRHDGPLPMNRRQFTSLLAVGLPGLGARCVRIARGHRDSWRCRTSSRSSNASDHRWRR